MQFERTGLKDDPLVRAAYDYFSEKNLTYKDEVILANHNKIDAALAEKEAQIEEGHDIGQYNDEQYKTLKEDLEQTRKAYDRKILMVAEQEAQNALRAAVFPVLELQHYSENPSPALLAGALLAAVARDAVDNAEIEKKFGLPVAALAAEIVHINAYPTAHDALVSGASKDAKRVMLAGITAELGSYAEAASMGQQLSLPPGEEKKLFETIKPLWGADAKLDARIEEVFNIIAKAAWSDFRLAKDAKGELELQAGANSVPRPPRPGRRPITPDPDL